MHPDLRRKITAVGLLVVTFTAGTALVVGTVPGSISAHRISGIDSCTTISEPGTYELTDDIENSGADRCLLVETGDVTLEGNGHLVDGTDRDSAFGVYVDADGGGEITVQDLTVRDWEEGVRIVDGETTVEGVEATSNIDGLNARRIADDVRFENIDAHDNTDDGVEAIHVTGLFVVDSRSTDNDGDGIYLDDADDGEVRNNVVEGNDEHGVHGFDPDDMSISDNEIRDNAEDGVHVHAKGASGARAEDMTISSNEITDNGDEGVHLTDLRRVGRITDNTVCNNDDKQFLIEDVPNVEMSGNDLSC